MITCRVDKANKTDGTGAKMITFLKTSEEAPCHPDDGCKWIYQPPAATLTSASVSFDGTNWVVTVSGTGFSGDSSTVELFANGIKQETTSVSPTEATFNVVNSQSNSLNGLKLYFPEGTPEAHDSILGDALLMTPKLASFIPNAGSVGGTEVIVSAPGLGFAESSDNVDLVSNGTSICYSKKILSYGVWSCRVFSMEIAAATDIKMVYSGSTIDCSNADATKC